MSDARTDAIVLLTDPRLRLEDPQRPSTWTYAGEPLTADQTGILGELTLADLDDVADVLRLNLELDRSEAAADSPPTMREIVAAFHRRLAD
jgi:hypothetical protein